jgi:hypothetical protein
MVPILDALFEEKDVAALVYGGTAAESVKVAQRWAIHMATWSRD